MLCSRRLLVSTLTLVLLLVFPVQIWAETTAHRVKRKLHKMEHRTGMLVNRMGLYLADGLFSPVSDGNCPNDLESDDDGSLFTLSFCASKDKPRSDHQSQNAKPAGHGQPGKKK